MYIDKAKFTKKVLEYKDQIIKHISELVKIPTVMDLKTSKKGQPFGKAIKDAGEYILNLAKADKFKTTDHNGYVYEISFGPKTKKHTATINHVDVVPVDNSKWSFGAFKPQIVNGFLLGRGVQDDKGPIIAVYYALKIMHELGYKLKINHKLLIGTNEENGSAGVNKYLKTNSAPEASFTADLAFPGVNCEKGSIRGKAILPLNDSNIISFKGGEAPNIVIPSFDAIVTYPIKKIKKSFETYLETNKLKGFIIQDKKNTKLHIDGVSAHGSIPETGVNAGTHMINYLATLSNDRALDYIKNKFHLNHGQDAIDGKLDESFASVSTNVGIIHASKGKISFNIDVRFPKGVESKEVILTWEASLFKNFKDPIKVTWGHPSEVLYFDEKEPIIQCLYGAFKDVTKRKDKLIITGGGTYAKSFSNCIAFGGAFKDDAFTMHAEDEKLNIESLLNSIPIYAEAILRLSNTKW